MKFHRRSVGIYFVLGVTLSLTACSGGGSSVPPNEVSSKGAQLSTEEVEIATERAKLSPEDRALVEAQEWCVVSNKARLGSMGVPIKLTIKGQPVFVCCGGCKRKAESDPEKILSKLEELKAKAQSQKDAKK